LVNIGAIAVENGVTGGIDFLDVGIANGLADEWFEIKAGSGSAGYAAPEEVPVACQEGSEDQMGLVWGEIVETSLDAYFAVFGQWNAAVEKSSETGGRLAFHDQLSDCELGVQCCRYHQRTYGEG